MLNRVFKVFGSLIFAAALLCATAGYIFLASTRSLPFLSENEREYSIIEDSSEESDSGVSEEPSEEPSGEESEESSVPTLSAVRRFLNSFPVAEEGIKPSGQKYSAETEILRLYGNVPYAAANTDINGVGVYMGYIYAAGNVYDSLLNDITAAVSGYIFSGERERDGTPLFSKDDDYYYLDDMLVMQKSDFSYIYDSRFVGYMIPEYSGVPYDPIFRTYTTSHSENKRYGFFDGDDRYYATNCLRTYAFTTLPDTDRLAGCGVKSINGDMRLVLFSDLFHTATKSNVVSDEYYPSESRDLSSIGYYYIDDGYTRVRQKNSDGTYTERLMYWDGSLLPEIAGFSIVGYSDSILLMKGDNGKYGYMTNRQNWIADPGFISAEPFLEGLAVVGTGTGYGVIDTTGKYVIPPVFERVLNCSGGIIAAYAKETGWSFFVKSLIPEENANVD